MRRVTIVIGLLLAWAACAAFVVLDPFGDGKGGVAAPLATLSVTGQPTGASVRVESPGVKGIYARGVADCELLVSADGPTSRTYTVFIEKPGYQPEERSVTVHEGATEEVSFKLQPVPNWRESRPRGQAHPITIAAVGDILLGEVEDPFGGVRDRLIDADVTFGNLESPLTTYATHTPGKTDEQIANADQYVFKAHPRWANDLALAGFDVLSGANNHAMDYCAEGLTETIKTLDAHGIKPVGIGPTWWEARSLRVVTVGNVRVGFLAASTIVPLASAAGPERPGIAGHQVGEPEQWLTEAITSARSKVDVLCVSFHWGIERNAEPEGYQRRIAEVCAKAGATFVIGHHPHCLQPIEVIDRTLVVYSLGNFVGLGTDDSTRQSMILRAGFEDGRVKWYETTPVRLENHRPAIAGEPTRTEAPTPSTAPPTEPDEPGQ